MGFFRKTPKISKENAKYNNCIINNIKVKKLDHDNCIATAYYVLADKEHASFDDVYSVLRKLYVYNHDLCFIFQDNILTIDLPVTGKDIIEVEADVFNIISACATRMFEADIIKHNFMCMFPEYDLSSLNFTGCDIEDIRQTINDNFGYFELTNEGMSKFNLEPVKKYGCVLEVHTLPDIVHHTYADIFNYEDNVTYFDVIKLLDQETEKTILTRRRAEDRYVLTGYEEDPITARDLEYVENALKELNGNEIFCTFTRYIILFDDSLDSLKERARNLIVYFREKGTIVAKSLEQAKTFFNLYVNKYIYKSLYHNLANLKFPLSYIRPMEIEEDDTDEKKISYTADHTQKRSCSHCGTTYIGDINGFAPKCPNCGANIN